MGRQYQRRLHGDSNSYFGSNKMKLLIAGLLCATVVLALPEGRRLRSEEHWRPAQGRDLSKYMPRQAMLPMTGLSEESKLRRTSGLGRWLFSLMMLGSVVDPSS